MSSLPAPIPARSSSSSTPRPNRPRSPALLAFRAQYIPGLVRTSRECEVEPSRVSENNRSETRKAHREWSAPFLPLCANCQERRLGTERLFDVRCPRRRTSRASKMATRSRVVYSTVTCCHKYAGACRQSSTPCGRVLMKLSSHGYCAKFALPTLRPEKAVGARTDLVAVVEVNVDGWGGVNRLIADATQVGC